jgi:hypothetical protein
MDVRLVRESSNLPDVRRPFKTEEVESEEGWGFLRVRKLGNKAQIGNDAFWLHLWMSSLFIVTGSWLTCFMTKAPSKTYRIIHHAIWGLSLFLILLEVAFGRDLGGIATLLVGT